jgi:drug/metabolite transporter (DMT)-like permease
MATTSIPSDASATAPSAATAATATSAATATAAPSAPSAAAPRPLFGALCALGGAAMWGLSNPFCKRLLDRGVGALDAAGMLYVGAALGLALVLGGRLALGYPRGHRVVRADLRWLLAATLVGGALAPCLMMYGQGHASGLATALLIAVEPPATAIIAVAMFGERLSRRLVVGGVFVLAGVLVVGLAPADHGGAGTTALGAIGVAAACTLWSLDSNLSTRVAHLDPMFVAMLKGLIAAPLVLAVAAALAGAPFWQRLTLAEALQLLLIGFVGYGLGIALMVRAFRELGAARVGALFSTTSLFAALGAIVVLGESPNLTLACAALLLGVGVLAIVTEKH